MIRRFIGNDMTRASARQAVKATGIRMPRPRRVHPGNLSSLKDEKSAFLQHMQGGYANPRIQRARYGLNTISNNIPNPSSFARMTNSAGNIFDGRASRGLSLSRLNQQ